MPTEKEIIFIQKATIYDLIRIFEEDPDKTYSVEEVKKLLNTYVKGVEQ